MTRLAAVLLVVLAGCTTTPPAIVDHWVPPQASTTADTRDLHCADDPLAATPVAEAEKATTDAAAAGVKERPVPCVAQELRVGVAQGIPRAVASGQRDVKPSAAGSSVTPQRPPARSAPRAYR